MDDAGSHPSAGKHLVARGPRNDLRGLVWRLTAFREGDATPYAMRETAALTVPLLIGFAGPFEIALARAPTPADTFVGFAAGLCRKPALIRSLGSADCVQIDFTPAGARAFFGAVTADLADRLVTLEDLGDPALFELRDRLAEASGPDRRLDLAEAFLVRRLNSGRSAAPVSLAALAAIRHSHGRLRIRALADRLDVSRQHLSALFAADFGLSPKAVARIARFEAAQVRAREATLPDWADIAAACGYADQAHLVRDFADLAGQTPTQWHAA
ncbi:MAG: helix-turn-helix domain-containing protein [Gemmobacter sp.]